MENGTLRKCVVCVLALACVIQTSLLVTFTVTHMQRQRVLQLSYRDLTQRARTLMVSCAADINSTDVGHDEASRTHVINARAAATDPILQHLVAQQELMLETHCSPTSKLCLPGPKGDTGHDGLQGLNGTNGDAGIAGLNGTTGAIGEPGRNGSDGTQGPAGAKGIAGEAGALGPKGQTGAAGVKGDAGVKGASGQTGAKGQPGAKGDPSAAGSAGDPGAKGQAGSKGDLGPAGPAGTPGASGPKGESGLQSGTNCSCFVTPVAQGASLQLKEALPGATLTLTCPVTATPSPTVTWSRIGGLPRDAKIVGTSLIIADMSSSDVGQYTCSAKNILGSASVTFDVRLSDLNCDFENGMCSWSQSDQDERNWLMNTGLTDTIATGPNSDHTLQTALGHYVYLESSEGVNGDTADLMSTSLRLTDPVCLQFFHSMYGADINSLSVIAKSSTGKESLIWTKTGDQGQGWHEAKVSVPPAADGGQTKIVFRATRGRSIDGDIAVDDIHVTSGMCIQPPSSIDCDFQSDTCGWSGTGDWSWSRRKGTSGKPNTGPLADHNADLNEYYSYADGSAAHAAGSKALLTSPFIDSSSPVCVEFYYHMFGSGEGSLAMNVKSQDGAGYTLWQRSGDQTQTWHHTQLTLPQGSAPYSLQFEATRGSSAASDMAVDDVNVTAGACPGRGNLGCDFEQLDLCTWTQDKSDDLDWSLQVAQTGGLNRAPPLDHTLQTERGHYVSMSSKGHTQGQKAALMSRTLPRQRVYCLSMWYYLPANSGNVEIWREVFGSRTEKLRTISYKAPAGGQSADWTHLSFSIPSYWTDYNIVLAASTGDPAAAPLAVDDVDLTSGYCV